MDTTITYLVTDKMFLFLRNKQNLVNLKSVFNYRIAQRKKIIKCVFGIAIKKFAVSIEFIRCHNAETVNDNLNVNEKRLTTGS